MATRTVSKAGGKWSETAAWVEGAVPTSADDVVATAESGNLTIAAEGSCRSLNLTNYVKKLKLEGFILNVGDATAGAGGVALKLVAGMTYNGNLNSVIKLVSTAVTEQSVDFGGKNLESTELQINGLGSSYKQIGALTGGSTTLRIQKGKYNTNAQTCSINSVFRTSTESPGVAELVIEGSTILVAQTTSIPWQIAEAANFTLKAAGSTIIMAASSGSGETKFRGGSLTYGNLKIEGAGTGPVLIEGENTFSNYDFTAAAGRTVKFQKEKKQTLTGGFTALGSAGKLVSMESSEAGKAWKISVAAGTVSLDYVSLKDSKAEGGAAFYAGEHSTNVSGNSGWTFTAPETAPAVVIGEAPVVIAAKLIGSINPDGGETEYHFEWGSSAEYGNSTSVVKLPASHEVSAVSATITGLVSSTLYHYRLVATNAKGTTKSADQSFVAAGGAVVSVVL